jgi:hypothetical protein
LHILAIVKLNITLAPKVTVLNFQVERSHFALYVAATDCLSVIILLAGLAVINVSLKTNENFFKKKVPKLSDYTLHFVKRGLNNTYIYWEISCLIERLNIALQIETKEQDTVFIYDINYPIFNGRLMSLYADKTEYNRKIKELGQAGGKENSIEKYRNKLQNLNKSIIKEREKGLTNIDDIFITFTDIKYVLTLKRALGRSKCKRCCIITCCMSDRINHL